MIEGWIALSLGAALSKAIKPPAMRLGGILDIPPTVMAWAASLGALPALGTLLIIEGIPEIRSGFLGMLIVASLFGVASAIFQAKALGLGDVSYVAPYESLGIVFAAAGSFLLLGETLSPVGLFGIATILAGSFVLQKNRGKDTASLKRNNDALLMILASYGIWGFSVNFEKAGILLSSPIFFAFTLMLFISILLTPAVVSRRRFVFANDGKRKKRLGVMVVLGMVTGLILMFQFAAFELTNISYVLAMKQLSALFAVVIGGSMFKERGLIPRFIGAVLLVVGAMLIARTA